QLLEYAYWPGSPGAEKIIVVGIAPYTVAAREYIQILQKMFSLPIDYEQCLIEDVLAYNEVK
ncbi:MAG: hypothetical protein ACRCWR_12125, partial [Saezia sp.]